MKNKVLKCKLCDKWWQTHERNQYLSRCPNCGSRRKDHINASVYGNRLFTSHLLPHSVYNELIFGSDGRTWHNQFGEIKGNWIKEHINEIKTIK
jgi:hypothetical protein